MNVYRVYRPVGGETIEMFAAGARVVQTVAAMALGPRTEAVFHGDSYGYQPWKGRTGHGGQVPRAWF